MKQSLCFFLCFFCLSMAIVESAQTNQVQSANANGMKVFSTKFGILHNIVGSAIICHRRYEKCSERFSGLFCISPLQNFSFYIWARRMANDIMNGKYDEHHGNVTCSKGFLKNIINGKLSSLVRLISQQNTYQNMLV